MKSLETVFKQVYAEALEPYGFQKIKGKRPYFVRLIGDEILHIITVAPEPTLGSGEKRYGIYGGVATVYRPRINLDITPRDNFNWLTNNHMIYRDKDIFEDKPDRFSGKYYDFFYIRDNEESLVTSMKETVDATRQVLLKELDGVTDFETCMEFLSEYDCTDLTLIDDGEFGIRYESNEGLVNFKVFHNYDEFVEYRKKRSEKYDKEMRYMIEKRMIGLSMESYEKRKIDGEKNRQRERDTFKKYFGDSQNLEKVMKEMERRKMANLEILKSYGLDV